MACEMCGKEEPLFRTEIEGSMLRVCKNCARFGKVHEIPKNTYNKPFKKVIQKEPVKEVEYKIVENYSELIRNKREKLGLTQEEFSNQLNEKESIMQKIENGKFTPSIATARKMEKILNLKLIEEVKESEMTFKKDGISDLTIGDMITIKKRN